MYRRRSLLPGARLAPEARVVSLGALADARVRGRSEVTRFGLVADGVAPAGGERACRLCRHGAAGVWCGLGTSFHYRNRPFANRGLSTARL